MHANLKDQFEHSSKFTFIISEKTLISETVEGRKKGPVTLPTAPSKIQQTQLDIFN